MRLRRSGRALVRHAMNLWHRGRCTREHTLQHTCSWKILRIDLRRYRIDSSGSRSLDICRFRDSRSWGKDRIRESQMHVGHGLAVRCSRRRYQIRPEHVGMWMALGVYFVQFASGH